MFAQFVEELLNPVNLVSVAIVAPIVIAALAYAAFRPKFFRLMLKNLGRNPVRTLLIACAITVLVAKVTLIWTVVYFLDAVTRERSKDFKLIITERWQLPSQIPVKHADYLDPDSPSFLPELKGKYGAKDFMSWSFYGGSVDPLKRTVQDIVFFIAMSPDHIKSMMDDLDTLDDGLIAKLKATRNGCLLGKERLKNLNKKVGERFKVYSFNYKGIDLDFEIVGELPEGRNNLTAIMRSDYFLGAFDAYEREKGVAHPLQAPDDRRLNLIWMRVPDRATFNEVGGLLEKTPIFANRPVKVETASSGIGSFLEAYADLLRGMKYLLVPAILCIMALVVAIAISISIRERRSEIAVMKVLGFKPSQVMTLVIGESLILGVVSGFVAALLTYGMINWVIGGIKFPIAFFPAFLVSAWAFAWGPAMGAFCALLGSFFPAQQARAVRVSEVFSRVA
jgi:putative ABC transport system permease protein